MPEHPIIEFSRRLSTLAPPPPSSPTTSTPSYSPQFRAILEEAAAWLIHCCRIVATNPSPKKTGEGVTEFAFCEVELYAFRNGVYEDRFTHCDAQQSVAGSWYFHKKGGTFKGGSFKGLDVTFGAPAGSHGAAVSVGVLIRSICPVSRKTASGEEEPLDPKRLVEGPSLVVDNVVAACGAASIVDLVGSKDGILMVSNELVSDVNAHGVAGHRFDSRLSLVWTSPQVTEDIVKASPFSKASCDGTFLRLGMLQAPRVGLVPRTPTDLVYAGRLLRCQTPLVKLAKQRAGVIAALLVLGMPSNDVQRVSGGTGKNVQQLQVLISDIGDKKKISLATIAQQAADGDGEFKKGGVLGGDVMQGPIITGIVAWAHSSNCL